MRKLMFLVLFAGCTIEAGKDVPPVVGDGVITVDGSQKIALDTTKVPSVPVCATGHYVRRTAGGWECVAVDLAARDTRLTALESSNGDLDARVTARESAATTIEGRATALEGRANTLEGRATSLEGSRDSFALQAGQMLARLTALEAATDALHRRANGLDARLAALEATDCPRGYARDAAFTTGILCKRTVAGGNVDEMVKVADFWIDRFEMQSCGGFLGRAEGTDTTAVGCSLASGTPVNNVTWFQAASMCSNAGKRLCTNLQWQLAATGTPDPGSHAGGGGVCVTSGSARAAGLGTACRSKFGAEDMIGNFHEMVAEWGSNGVYTGSGAGNANYWYPNNQYSDYIYGVSGSSAYVNAWGYVTYMPAMVLRGGNYNNGFQSGAFYYSMFYGPTSAATDTSARCCKEGP